MIVLSLCFRRESDLAGEALHLLVELRAIVAWLGAEHCAAASEKRGVDVAATCAAAALPASELARGAGDFAALLALVRALTLVAEILFYVKIDCVVGVAFAKVAGEYLVVEGDLASCVFSFDVVNCYFHYFSTMTIEPLAPGMEPLITNKLCSGSTFITWRFCTVTRSLPIR